MDKQDKADIEAILKDIESCANANNVHKYKAVPEDIIDRLKSLIKWEPKEYEDPWISGGVGDALQAEFSDEEWRLAGNEWPTKELAETARDMNKRNQLILQYKNDPDNMFGDGNWAIYYLTAKKRWKTSYVMGTENPELTFEKQEQAEEVIRKLGLNVSPT